MKNAIFVLRPCEILHWASHNLVHYGGLHSGVAKVGDGCSMICCYRGGLQGGKFWSLFFLPLSNPEEKKLVIFLEVHVWFAQRNIDTICQDVTVSRVDIVIDFIPHITTYLI
jgi:hypothetical protein